MPSRIASAKVTADGDSRRSAGARKSLQESALACRHGAVAHVGIGGGVALVEAIAREGGDLLPELFRLLLSEPGPTGSLASCNEGFLEAVHLLGSHFAHPASNVVCLGPRQTRDLRGDFQHLLLEDQHALRPGQDRLEGGVQVMRFSFPAVAPDEGVRLTTGCRARFEEGVGDGQVLDGSGPELAQRAPCPDGIDLETADGVTRHDQVGCLRIVGGDVGESEAWFTPPHLLGRIGEDGECTDPQKIQLLGKPTASQSPWSRWSR